MRCYFLTFKTLFDMKKVIVISFGVFSETDLIFKASND